LCNLRFVVIQQLHQWHETLEKREKTIARGLRQTRAKDGITPRQDNALPAHHEADQNLNRTHPREEVRGTARMRRA